MDMTQGQITCDGCFEGCGKTHQCEICIDKSQGITFYFGDCCIEQHEKMCEKPTPARKPRIRPTFMQQAFSPSKFMQETFPFTGERVIPTGVGSVIMDLSLAAKVTRDARFQAN